MDGEGFGEEIGQVVFTLTPFDDELLPSNAITDPVILHFDALCTFGLYCVVGNALGTPIISENICGWLWVAKVGENLTKASTMLSSEETGNIFCFTDRGHYRGDNGGHDMNCAIDLSGIIVAEVRNSSGDRAGTISREV